MCEVTVVVDLSEHRETNLTRQGNGMQIRRSRICFLLTSFSVSLSSHALHPPPREKSPRLPAVPQIISGLAWFLPADPSTGVRSSSPELFYQPATSSGNVSFSLLIPPPHPPGLSGKFPMEASGPRQGGSHWNHPRKPPETTAFHKHT